MSSARQPLQEHARADVDQRCETDLRSAVFEMLRRLERGYLDRPGDMGPNVMQVFQDIDMARLFAEMERVGHTPISLPIDRPTGFDGDNDVTTIDGDNNVTTVDDDTDGADDNLNDDDDDDDDGDGADANNGDDDDFDDAVTLRNSPRDNIGDDDIHDDIDDDAIMGQVVDPKSGDDDDSDEASMEPDIE